PARIRGQHGKIELHLLIVRIEEQEKIAVDDDLTAFVVLVERAAREKHAQRARKAFVPLLLGHLRAVRIQPDDVSHGLASNSAILEKAAAAEHAVSASELDQLAREGEEILVFAIELPVVPGDLVVLTVGVVVAALGASRLVAGEQHRHACDSSNVVRKLRICRALSARTAGSSVGPSTPQFQLRL